MRKSHKPPVIPHRRHESKPADPPISLFARLHRQLATPEGAERSLVTLGGYFNAAYRRDAAKSAGSVRAALGEAKRMVLDKEFISLCAAYCATATPEELQGLYGWAHLPFDPLWLEWPNPQVPEHMRRALPLDFADRPEDEVHDSKASSGRGASESQTGVLLHHVKERDAVHCVTVFVVPDDPMAVVMPPSAFLFKPGFPEWVDADLHGKIVHGLGSVGVDYARLMHEVAPAMPPNTEVAEDRRMADMLSSYLLVGVNESPYRPTLRAHFAPLFDGWMAPLRRRVMPTTAHSGGEALSLMYSMLSDGQMKLPDNEAGLRLVSEQVTRAGRLLQAVLPLVPVALGMLSLAPIRHVTDRIPSTIHPQRPNDWRWRHAHETVTLTRPLTVAEVVVHVTQPSGPSRASPMLHEVMGFWRVRSGVPSCNHVWHEERRAEGTDTELGRPHRTAMLRYRCTKCQGLRSWVTSHHRGDPARGVKSKDYIIEGDA